MIDFFSGLTDESNRKPSTIEMYGPGSRNSADLSGRAETVSSSLQSEKTVRFSMSDDTNRYHIVSMQFLTRASFFAYLY